MRYYNKVRFLFVILCLWGYCSKAQYNYSLKIKDSGHLNISKISVYINDGFLLDTKKKPFIASQSDSDYVLSGQLIYQSVPAVIVFRRGEKDAQINFVLDAGYNEIDLLKLDNTTFKERTENIKSNPSVTRTLAYSIDSLENYYYRNYSVPNPINNQVSFLNDSTRLKLQDDVLKLINRNPTNFYSLMLLYKMTSIREQLDKVLIAFNNLDKKLRLSNLGLDLIGELKSIMESQNIANIGNMVPDFSVETPDNKIFENRTLNGQPYIIAFSATWCIPCQTYQKKLKQLYDKYKPSGLKVVYFNLDDDVLRWEQHIAKNRLDWINVSERKKINDSKISLRFEAYSIPLYIVVNREGRIIYNSSELSDVDFDLLEPSIVKSLN